MKHILEEPGILRKYFQSKYTDTKKFRHILVDEAQDLPGDWLELLRELLNKKEDFLTCGFLKIHFRLVLLTTTK